ncbi:MAG: NAD(P)H-hydrate dehydratase [Gammaproteobacteria bacterium]|nr:NAD(P)H-hydrate dehydratase [Gammaproteobacteria bacterium]
MSATRPQASTPVLAYSASDVRAIDSCAIEQHGIPGIDLMRRAGAAALAELRRRWPEARRLLVVCGNGNNGGDGYVVGQLAREAGLESIAAALQDPAGLTGDAARAAAAYVAAGGAIVAFDPGLLAGADVVVDALLGTGLAREVEGPMRGCIEAINAASRPVLAIDVPSGLDADTGAVHGVAVRAGVTVTFVARKVGLYLGESRACAGDIVFDDLGIPAACAATVRAVAALMDAQLVRRALPPRGRLTHKGQLGHVLVIGGGEGMPGAVRLAAEAALRAGAGLVSVATRPENVSAIVGARPELMVHGIGDESEARALLAPADVIAIGPGLGQTPWARGLLEMVLASGKPVIADADALNLLAQSPWRSPQWVLTPHPGEAARLLGGTVAAVQADRLGAARALADRYGGVVVLKGAGSLVLRQGGWPWICDRGNPGMAGAGMGDVLTGLIAGLAAQCRDLELAAAAAVFAHASAGDLAAAGGQVGVLAGELFGPLRACLNDPL